MLNKPQRTYSTREVAQHLGVSVQTVQRWVDAGQLKAWKTVGGHRRIDLASAEALLRRNGAVPASRPPDPLHVLVVDGNDAHRQSLARHVMAALPSAEVIQDGSAFSALLSMGARMPDVLIIDFWLVGVDAPAMLRHLVGAAKAGPQKIFVLLAHGLDPDLPTGVTPLREPVDADLLRRALRGAVTPPGKVPSSA